MDNYMELPLDYDGAVIRVGDVVYGRSDNKKWKVIAIGDGEYPVHATHGNETKQLKPQWLVHEYYMSQDDIDDYIKCAAKKYIRYNGNGMYEDDYLVPIDVVDNALEFQRKLDERIYKNMYCKNNQ